MDALFKIILKLLILSAGFRRPFGYDDLSNGKASSQVLTNPCPLPKVCGSLDIASNAVDRDTSTCTSTQAIGGSSPKTSVWWRVDLGDIYSIHSIRILFKEFGPDYVMRQRGRFAGFSLYLSNSTKNQDWVLCYKDGPELPPLDFNRTCMKYGRYVIYYNERSKEATYPAGYEIPSYTALCEVIVYGCEKNGVYGVNCHLSCPADCSEQRCHIAQGTCLRCRPGWTGGMCTKPCPDGWYGQGCKNKCAGHCKNNDPCHTEFGSCVGGCASGWMGTMCNKECQDGSFGPGCIHNCSGHCLNSSHCNKTTGTCGFGCSPGYTESFCNKTCSSGKFGIQCRETCSGNCLNATKCNHVDGNCDNGCENGYSGMKCNRPCEKGYFGSNCSQKCSENCLTSLECNKSDGSCTCSPGWTGSPHCNKECDIGYYGKNCQRVCNIHCKNRTCAKDNGNCLTGCMQPFYGDKCDQGGEKCSIVSYAKEYHAVSGVLGALVFVLIVMFAVVFARTRNFHMCIGKKHENFSTQLDEADKAQLDGTVEKDRALYQELDVIENKSIYHKLYVEGNTYQNLALTTN